MMVTGSGTGSVPESVECSKTPTHKKYKSATVATAANATAANANHANHVYDAYVVCLKNASTRWKRAFVALLRKHVPRIAKYKRDETILKLVRFPVHVIKRTKKHTIVAFDSNQAGAGAWSESTKRAKLANAHVFLVPSYALTSTTRKQTKGGSQKGGDGECLAVWITQKGGTCWYNAVINCFAMSESLREMFQILFERQFERLKNEFSFHINWINIHKRVHPDFAKKNLLWMFQCIMYVLYMPGVTLDTKETIVGASARSFQEQINDALIKQNPNIVYDVFLELLFDVTGHGVLRDLNMEFTGFAFTDDDNRFLANRPRKDYVYDCANICNGEPYLYKTWTTGWVSKSEPIQPPKYLYHSKSKRAYILTCSDIGIMFKNKVQGHAVAGIFCSEGYHICDSNYDMLIPCDWHLNNFSAYIDLVGIVDQYDQYERDVIDEIYNTIMIYQFTTSGPEKGDLIHDLDVESKHTSSYRYEGDDVDYSDMPWWFRA